jgi:hypothetical protein
MVHAHRTAGYAGTARTCAVRTSDVQFASAATLALQKEDKRDLHSNLSPHAQRGRVCRPRRAFDCAASGTRAVPP